MPSLTLSDRLIWFAHCPKAGGTSVEQFMVARWGAAVGHLHWGWDLWWRDGGWRVADPPNSPQHLIWRDAADALPRPPDAVFALVRDPANRIASEYRWQGSGRRGTRLGKALARLPFSIWLRLMLAVAARNPHAFDNHLRPQSDFVPDTACVFRLEDGLDPVLDWLAEETGETPKETMGHAIATARPTRIGPKEAGRIAEAFAADYTRFGYVPMAPPPGTVDLMDGLARGLAPCLAWLERRGRL